MQLLILTEIILNDDYLKNMIIEFNKYIVKDQISIMNQNLECFNITINQNKVQLYNKKILNIDQSQNILKLNIFFIILDHFNVDLFDKNGKFLIIKDYTKINIELINSSFKTLYTMKDNLQIEEKSIFLCQQINKIIKVFPSFKNLIKIVNDITIRLKDQNLRLKQINKFKQNRFKIVRYILPFLDQNKSYFLFPNLNQNLYISKNIAIVGNSRKLLKNIYGKFIDSHTNIIRFKFAITKNFEIYTGIKNDIRVCSINCLRGDSHPDHPPGFIQDYNLYRTLPESKYILFSKIPLINSNILTTAKKNNIDISNKQFYNIVWNTNSFQDFLKKFQIQLLRQPQIGTGIILSIVELGIIPNIFGFDLESNLDNYGYYWSGNLCRNKLSPSHDIKNEHDIIKKLIESKYLFNFG